MNYVHKHTLFFLLFWVIPLSICAQEKKRENPELYTFVKLDKKYIVSIDDNVDLIQALSQFCIDQKIKSGAISGFGMAKEVTLRFIDPDNKRYSDKNIYEQVTIANLTGSISQLNNEAYLLVHATIGRSDYKMEAGHLVSAIVNGMLECIVEEYDVVLERRLRVDTGINVYDFK